jgi:hypothetical protein
MALRQGHPRQPRRPQQSDDDRAGDEYTGTNGHEAWQSMGKPMIGWDTHQATI